MAAATRIESGITAAQASRFARMTLAGITREYPNKPGDVLLSARDLRPTKAVHPAFYGCYDWHSSVHGHWMLARLLRILPDLAEAKKIRRTLGATLTRANLDAEAASFARPEAKSFERTYGWAWLLKLAQELQQSRDAEVAAWARNLKPLADTVVALFLDFLPRQTYPIRTGLHNNTAFGLAFAHDYAVAARNMKLKNLIAASARNYYIADRDCPAAFEPGGSDFFSPALIEADLMRRVLQPAEFRRWFRKLLPRLSIGEPASLLKPARVTDRSDPQLIHLDGLNLSRAWCMRAIAAALNPRDGARGVLIRSARTHARAGLVKIASGHYGGEHWLASFAVQLLTTPESG